MTVDSPPNANPGAGASVASPELNAHVRGLAPYPPGKPIEEVQREFGLTDVVKLASNENPLGPSPRALEAARAAMGEAHLYPDGAAHSLRAELAARLGVAPEELVLGNGSDEITIFAALCFLGPGRSLVTSDYAFVRYRMAATLVGAESRLAPMRDFRHDPAAILDVIDDTTAMVCLDNPCNPTGTILTRAQVVDLLRRIPERVLVLLDEAYFEFARRDPDYPDGLTLRGERANLLVTRTFSKAYGLAGFRVGYGVTRREIARDMDRVRPPFNTGRVAQAAALAALDDAEHLRATTELNEAGRRQLEAGLRAMGLRPEPTHANFVFVDLSPLGRGGAEFFDALQRRGVIVRPMGGYGLGGHVRISIGTEAENRRALEALEAERRA